MRALACLSIALGLLAAPLPSDADSCAPATFAGLDDFDGPPVRNEVEALSADGRVAVGTARPNLHDRGVRWVDGEIQGLPLIPGNDRYSRASGVSPDGSVIVGDAGFPGTYRAVLWTGGFGFVLGDLPGGDLLSVAYGVSRDGRVVGVSESAYAIEPTLWVGPDVIPLGDLPGGGFPSGGAYAITPDGDAIVGGSDIGFGSEATLWRGGAIVGLGDLPGRNTSSRATAVTEDGRVVVGIGSSETANSEAFLWTELTGIVGLGDVRPGGSFSEALGVTPDGDLVVGRGSGFAGDNAALWIDREGRTVATFLASQHGRSTAGWVLKDVRGVADRENLVTLVGNGFNPDGDFQAWIATFPTACSDCRDNDGDGLTDDLDPGCASPGDKTEVGRCENGIDDDGDGFADFPDDTGCEDASDDDELDPAVECDDGIDNDGDGLVDARADPGCFNLAYPVEDPECEDGEDNDGDGAIDDADPQCRSASDFSEGCGLGPELVLIVPLLLRRRRARRRA